MKSADLRGVYNIFLIVLYEMIKCLSTYISGVLPLLLLIFRVLWDNRSFCSLYENNDHWMKSHMQELKIMEDLRCMTLKWGSGTKFQGDELTINLTYVQ